jgi:gamma-D-glutamyl-L-lysine dipeptidyl-peptidase
MNPPYVIQVAVAPVRQEPSDRAEQITQFLYSEGIAVLERREKWSLVRSQLDGYEGWIDNKQYRGMPKGSFKPQLVHSRQAVLANESDVLWVPHGSVLLLDGAGRSFDGRQAEPVDVGNPVLRDINSILQTAEIYLNTPYLWGGRSIWGIDCSGFMQQVFRLHGLELPRDAYQQATVGADVLLIGEAQAGDLVFFDNNEGRITHVGLYLGDGRIIHASGRVRIDKLDHFGIYHQEEARYTHQLRLIKRVV